MQRQWSLLIGGLLRAADMPGLDRQVVPRADEISAAAQVVLGPHVAVTEGHADKSVSLGLDDDPNYKWTSPRRYRITAPAEIPASNLYTGLVAAVLDVAPLPSGIISDWTIRIVLEDEHGMRVADKMYEIQQGGGRRRLLSLAGMSGAIFGGATGAFIGGPVGAVVGLVAGGAVGEVIERQFPSKRSTRASDSE